jgi:hypothetical protein
MFAHTEREVVIILTAIPTMGKPVSAQRRTYTYPGQIRILYTVYTQYVAYAVRTMDDAELSPVSVVASAWTRLRMVYRTVRRTVPGYGPKFVWVNATETSMDH